MEAKAKELDALKDNFHEKLCTELRRVKISNATLIALDDLLNCYEGITEAALTDKPIHTTWKYGKRAENEEIK